MTLERSSLGVLKNRRKYPSLIVAMTRVFEQFASKAHGFYNWSRDPVFKFPVLLVAGVGESDARKFQKYFELKGHGTLLDSHHIYMHNNPLSTVPHKDTVQAVKKEFGTNKHAFSVLFHEQSEADQTLQWLQNNLPHLLVYKDALSIQQKIKKRA